MSVFLISSCQISEAQQHSRAECLLHTAAMTSIPTLKNRESWYLKAEEDDDQLIRVGWRVHKCSVEGCTTWKNAAVWSWESEDACRSYYKHHLKHSTAEGHSWNENQAEFEAATVTIEDFEQTFAERQEEREQQRMRIEGQQAWQAAQDAKGKDGKGEDGKGMGGKDKGGKDKGSKSSRGKQDGPIRPLKRQHAEMDDDADDGQAAETELAAFNRAQGEVSVFILCLAFIILS